MSDPIHIPPGLVDEIGAEIFEQYGPELALMSMAWLEYSKTRHKPAELHELPDDLKEWWRGIARRSIARTAETLQTEGWLIRRPGSPTTGDHYDR